MRVLVLSTCYPRFAGDFAGAHVERGVRRLIAAGHEITVVAPADDRLEAATFAGGARVERVRYLPRRWRSLPYGYGGIPVHLRQHPLRVLQVPFLLAAMAFATLRHASRVDVVHANWLFTAISALPARWLRRTPLAVTLRGSDMALAEAHPSTRLAARVVLRAAAAVTPVSEDLAERAKALGALPERTRVVADGAETEGFETREAARAALGLPAKRTVLLFVGNVIPVKGVDVLVEAVGELRRRDVDLLAVLVGGGEDRHEHERRARELGLDERHLRFVGFRPTDEVPRWLAACDLFCLPSRSEGLPNALLEAMGAGRPAVVTGVGGMPSLVEDGASGLVVPAEQPGALADALARLADDPDLRGRMGERARAILAERGLTWDATAKAYSAIYSEVVGSCVAPRDRFHSAG